MQCTIRLAFVAALLVLAAAPAPSRADPALEPVAFGIDWKAEAEYGGYYQAVATGIYARHGLAVSIRQGGPQINQTQLLLAGRLDFSIASNSFLALNFVAERIPFRAVAAFYQKDPSVLIAHPGTGHDSFEALRGVPILIGADTRAGWWNYLRVRFGYTDSQIRPYTFNLAPFLSNPQAVQQGFVGSEPFSIRQETGADPVVLLLSDAGFSGYGSLIAASDATIAAKPDLVRRFVQASAEGWRSYLLGDPAPADALIKRENPEMTDALLAYGRRALIANGIVLSGDAARFGIGAMTEARWEAFFRSMAEAGLYPPTLDHRRAYTLQFSATGVTP